MNLFLLEHKKLWRKRLTKISVLLCFVYVVVFGGILSFQWFSFGSSGDHTSAFGNNFDGYAVVKPAAKSPPPITLPARAVDTAISMSFKKDFS